jgi:hypothetical protein
MAPKPKAKKVTVVPADPDPSTMHFWGTCGASAAIALDNDRVVVGSDDDNFLRTYDVVEPDALVVRDENGQVDPGRVQVHEPRSTQNLYPFLKVGQFSRRNFSAIEGATIAGDLSYWIGSHARRKDGENRPNRRRLFAMSVKPHLGVQVLAPFGQPVADLAHRMAAADELKPTGIGNAIRPQYRRLEYLAPQVRGLDIQGLTTSPGGDALWIALRNPRRGTRAYVLPLENPREVVQGKEPVFGAPISLQLGGRGLSAIQWVPARGEYLLVSGEVGQSSGYRLHTWSGAPTSPPSAGQPLPDDLDVQSFYAPGDAERILLFSDDSDVRVPVESKEVCRTKRDAAGTCPCSRVEGQGPKRFRARWFEVAPPAS